MRGLSYSGLIVGVCLVSVPLLGDSERPSAVSPGSATVSRQLASSCPTFSWGGVTDASGYELVIYRVAENGELQTVREAKLPRGATSWTPSAAECPDSGSRFAWAVRALGKRGAGRPWSEALLFETAGPPTDDEVRQAMLVLRRYREAQSKESLPAEDGAPLPDGRREQMDDPEARRPTVGARPS